MSIEWVNNWKKVGRLGEEELSGGRKGGSRNKMTDSHKGFKPKPMLSILNFQY